jgi:hypothetical protein
LATSPSLRQQILWLVWFLPQLERAVLLDPATRGFSWLSQWDTGIRNGLSYCSAAPDHVLVPDNVFIPTRAYHDHKNKVTDAFVPWEQRKSICFWRGATTGQRPVGSNWTGLQRVQLVKTFLSRCEDFDVGLSKLSQISNEKWKEEIAQAGLMKAFVPAHLQQHWKYLIDIDGNSNAWSGLFEKLLTGSVVMKVESPHAYRQWYYGKMNAWEHYVPVAADFRDLEGKLRILQKNDLLALQIGRAGLELASSLSFESQLDFGAEAINRAVRIFREGW